MHTITITSDLGTGSIYLATLKGRLASHLPDARIIDIVNDLDSYDVKQASFVLRNSYPAFPPGTVHIADLDSSLKNHRRYIVIEKDEQFFISADNGLFTLVFDDTGKKMHEVILKEGISHRFEMFADTAAHIFAGTFDTISKPITRVKDYTPIKLLLEENSMRGLVLYIDRFGNCITNINRNAFESHGQGRPFKIISPRFNDITIVSDSYSDAGAGDILCRFTHNNYLEIAVNNGSASQLLGLRIGSMISILFEKIL